MIPWWTAALIAVIGGSVVGFALFWLLGESTYRRGMRVGERKASLTSQGHPVIADGWNPAGSPQQRRRSPDHQMVTRTAEAPLQRSVFYR